MRFRTILKILIFPVYVPLRACGCGGFYNHYIANKKDTKNKIIKGVI